MQKSESKKDYAAILTIKTMNMIPSPDRSVLAQFYSFDDEAVNAAVSPLTASPTKEGIPKLEPLLRSPSSASKSREIQAQLELNQSKLNSLVKRIDECLSASKNGFSNAQVIQKSLSSLSVSSMTDNKEVKAPEQTIQEFKPDEPSDEALLSPNLSNGIMKSVRASMDTTTEEIAVSLGIKRRSMDNIKKNNLQQKEKTGQSTLTGIKPIPVAPKGVPKAPVSAQRAGRQNAAQKGSNSLGGSDIQKKLDTVSSTAIETVEDLPKPKERVGPTKLEKQASSASNKKGLNQSKSTVNDPKMSASNLTEVEKSGLKAHNEMSQSEHRGNAKPMEKARSPGRSDIKLPVSSSKTQKSLSTVPLEKKMNQKEEKKDLNNKGKIQKSPQPVKPEVPKKEPVNKVSQEKGYLSSARTRMSGAVLLPEECLPDLEEIRMISPVSQDTKSAKGVYDILTPGYIFESPMHQNGNLSGNDSKNLSFDSALLRMDGFETRRKSAFNTGSNEQSKLKESMKRNNSVKPEKSYKEEDLEVGFAKAYTTRKNRIVNEGSDFEERRDSDLHYRRKYRNELKKFLTECKPTLSEDQTDKLIQRLADDARRREAKAHRLEYERGNRERKNSTPISEDQLNQTFERLVNDAKKRLLLHEEQEKVKILKQEELEKSIQRERSKGKISRDTEDRLVSKLVEDADRRKLQYEKTQRAKREEEVRQANELQSQGFKVSKNNKSKSKVREYINSKTEISIEKEKDPKSIQKTDKSRTPSPVEILPTIKERPTLSERKFAGSKKMHLLIGSPVSKAAEGKEQVINLSKVTPKNKSLTNLEHLQNLRKNINKHRNDIEEHIQHIEEIEGNQIRNQPGNQPRVSQHQARKSDAEKIISPKKEKILPKVTSRYDHIESKVAKHIENMNLKPTPVESPEDLATISEVKELPKTAVTSPKSIVKEVQREDRFSLDFPRTSLISPKAQNAVRELPKDISKQARTDRELMKNRVSPQNANAQAKFMSDKAAIDFVDKLINEFKIVKNM